MEEMKTAATAAAAEETKKSSYRYWVREAKQDAAPRPVPRKLSPDDIPKLQSNSSSLGSVWNQVLFLIFFVSVWLVINALDMRAID